MPRTARIAPGGVIFHVLNRAIARLRIFERPPDYRAFEHILAEGCEKLPMRMLAYCIMPNHWHLLLWPLQDGDLGRFMHRLTTTHARRWRSVRDAVGGGHLYQGTYKSFPIEDDVHFLTVARYVERNPVRASLVKHAQDWRPSSLWRRLRPKDQADLPPLSQWPISRPRNWVTRVNRPETDRELAELRTCVNRGRPFGSEVWRQAAAARLNLRFTFRSRGRPPAKRG